MTNESRRVLLVDDEASLLDGLRRRHRKHFDMVAALGPEAALRVLAEEGPFAVVVSDFRMPGQNGAEFLAEVRERQPDTTRIMLTGQADLAAATEAINRGNIFRFLSKPCDPALFQRAVSDGIEQYELVHAERLLLERTLKGSIEVLVEVLGLANPAVFGRATRVRHYVAHVARALGLHGAWQVETAALLSQIGCVAVPNDVFERIGRGEQLPAAQGRMIERHPELAQDLLHRIPRLERVAEIVGRQNVGARDQDGLSDIVLYGSRILASALEYDQLISLGASPEQAIRSLRTKVEQYGSDVLEALASAQPVADEVSAILMPLDDLVPGMVLDEDVRNVSDTLILARGHVLTAGSLARLRNYAQLDMLKKIRFLTRHAGGKRGAVA